jgi:hypothetical protein
MALDGGDIDGYVCEKPGAISAVLSNSNFTYVEFEKGHGFTYDPTDSCISVGVRKGSNLTNEINNILASFDSAEKEEMMTAAITRQPAQN